MHQTILLSQFLDAISFHYGKDKHKFNKRNKLFSALSKIESKYIYGQPQIVDGYWITSNNKNQAIDEFILSEKVIPEFPEYLIINDLIN